MSLAFLSGEVMYCANLLNMDLRVECPIGSLTLTQHCTVSTKAHISENLPSTAAGRVSIFNVSL